jgi:branched-chain amino acid transport system ATP-binding protein
MPTSSAELSRVTPPYLSIEALAAGYGDALIVSGVDITVGLGEVVVVIGPNGAGKSTLLKAITGRIPVVSGRVRMSGREITNLPGHQLARLGVGYVPQTRDVFDTLTVKENLEMGGYLLSRAQVPPAIDRVIGSFPALGPMLDRHASKLSGGERKMLAFGRVLMLEPQVLILDEPTSNLSPDLSRRVLRDHVRRLADAGTAILLVEQKAFEALEVCDWGYVLTAGTPQISGPGSELLARPDIREVFLGRAAEGTNKFPGGGTDRGAVAT